MQHLNKDMFNMGLEHIVWSYQAAKRGGFA